MPYSIGCRVQGWYDDGKWYDGILASGPLFRIEFEDGEEVYTKLPDSDIRQHPIYWNNGEQVQ